MAQDDIENGHGHETSWSRNEMYNGEHLIEDNLAAQLKEQPKWRRLRQRLFSLSGPSPPDGTGRARSRSSAQEREQLRDQQFDDFLNLASDPVESAGTSTSSAAKAPGRKPVPKIDISAAQQWSQARSAGAQASLPYVQNQHKDQDVPFDRARFYTKPRRRPGLSVSFSTAAPDVIGQGGDEAPEPPADLAAARWKLRAGTRYQTSAGSQRVPPQNAANPMHARVMRKAVPPTLRAYSHGESTPQQTQSYSSQPPQAPELPPRRHEGSPASGPLLNLPVSDTQRRGPRRVSEADASHAQAAAAAVAAAVAPAGQSSQHLETSPDFEEQRSSPSRGLRRMRAEEGRALVSASQRNRLSVPDGMILSHGRSYDDSSPAASADATSSLQVIPPRLSFESDRTSSHHSTTSVQSMSASLPDAEKFDTSSPLAEMQRTKAGCTLPDAGNSAKAFADFSQDPLVVDFADRVEHLRSVFRLSAQLRQGLPPATEYDWNRMALWWFLRSVTVIEDIVQRGGQHGFSEPSARSSQAFAIHMQSIVNLAKTWFILTEIFSERQVLEDNLKLRMLEELKQHFMHLLQFIQHEQLMPPGSLLIQGLDTSLWVNEPDCGAENATLNLPNCGLLDIFPLGDSEAAFYYNRAFAQLQLLSRITQLNQAPFTGLVSIIRSKSNHQISLAVSSPTHVGIIVSGHPTDHITWQQVRWEREHCSLRVNVGQGLRLSVTFHSPRDFHTLLSLYDYGCRIMASLKPKDDERLLATLALREFQYLDTGHPHAFSQDPAKHCPAMLFERTTSRFEGYRERHTHHGHRLVVLSGREERHLRCVSVGLDRKTPLVYDALTTGDTAKLTLHIQQHERSRVLSMTFHSTDELLHLRDWLTGDGLAPNEQLLERLPLTSFDAVPLDADASASTYEKLDWHSLDVVTPIPESHQSNILPLDTHKGANWRLILRHANGTLVDHAGYAPYRLSLDPASHNSISLLRHNAQPEATLAIGPHPASQRDLAATRILSSILFSASPYSTICSYTFHTLEDLHVFQRIAISSAGAGEQATILFDALIPSFTISAGASTDAEDHSTTRSRRRKAAGLITSALRKGDARLRGSTEPHDDEKPDDVMGATARVQLISILSPMAARTGLYMVAFFDEGHPMGASAIFHIASSENVVPGPDRLSVRVNNATLLTMSTSESSSAGFASLNVSALEQQQQQQLSQDVLLQFGPANDCDAFMRAVTTRSAADAASVI